MLQTAVPYRPAEAARAKPFLKWAGGKTQLLGEIMAQLPEQYGRYYEPFLGGGAVYFALRPERATLSDINHELIETYNAVRRNLRGVIKALKGYRCASEDYYRVRAQAPDTLTPIQRAARLIYLNRTCFNGLYRVNRDGRFNVPFGKYQNPTICHVENLERVHKAMRGVRLRCQPVWQVARQARRGDLVYFDPPYVPVSPTARFTQYTCGGFTLHDQKRLAKLFAQLAARGVSVVLSNSDTPVVRALYSKFEIRQVLARRAINRSADGRGAVAEVLVCSVARNN